MSTPSYLTTRLFWRDTAERVVSTAAQTAVAAFGTGAFSASVAEGDLGSLPWAGALAVTVLAAFLAFLKALAAKGVGNSDSASLVATADPKPLSGPASGGYNQPRL